MKYFSEKLNKVFDTEAAVVEAEAAYDAEQEKKLAEVAERVNTKKEMAKAIEDADAALTEALEAYDKAKADINKIYDEAFEESKEILKPARKAVMDAKAKKLEAIAEFNKKFGTYEVKYVGDKALREANRIQRMIDTKFDSVFHNFWL